MEFDKNVCPVLNVDGVMATGKQYDLEINLPEDNRNVIFGVVKDCYKEPVQNAVVKLIEVVCDKGHEEKRPVSHTFTDCDGEFVFGPLCHNKMYEIQLWVDNVKHVKSKNNIKLVLFLYCFPTFIFLYFILINTLNLLLFYCL